MKRNTNLHLDQYCEKSVTHRLFNIACSLYVMLPLKTNEVRRPILTLSDENWWLSLSQQSRHPLYISILASWLTPVLCMHKLAMVIYFHTLKCSHTYWADVHQRWSNMTGYVSQQQICFVRLGDDPGQCCFLKQPFFSFVIKWRDWLLKRYTDQLHILSGHSAKFNRMHFLLSHWRENRDCEWVCVRKRGEESDL